MKIKFSTPTPETPGYLRRIETAARLLRPLQGGHFTAEVISELIHFLSTFVTDPSTPLDAREALRDLSQNDFEAMLVAIMGGGETVVPLASDKPSRSGGILEEEQASLTGSLS